MGPIQKELLTKIKRWVEANLVKGQKTKQLLVELTQGSASFSLIIQSNSNYVQVYKQRGDLSPVLLADHDSCWREDGLEDGFREGCQEILFDERGGYHLRTESVPFQVVKHL